MVTENGRTQTKMNLNKTKKKKKRIGKQKLGEIDNLYLNSKNAWVYIQILGVQRDIPQFKLD